MVGAVISAAPKALAIGPLALPPPTLDTPAPRPEGETLLSFAAGLLAQRRRGPLRPLLAVFATALLMLLTLGLYIGLCVAVFARF